MPMVMRHDEQYGRENSRSLRSIRHHRRYLISMKMSCCALQWNDYAALLNTYSERKFDSLFIQIKIISVVSCWSPNTAKLKEASETLFNHATMRVHPFYSPSHLFLDWYFISQVVPSHRDLCKHLDAKKENPSALPEAYTISSVDRPVGSFDNLLRPLTLPNVNQKIRSRLRPPNMYFPFPQDTKPLENGSSPGRI